IVNADGQPATVLTTRNKMVENIQLNTARKKNKSKQAVDEEHETNTLPISDALLTLHVSAFEYISQTVEGDNTYSHVTCCTTNTKEPGEISARSSNFNDRVRLMIELFKKYRNREAQEKNPKLQKFYIKPNIETESITSDLEARISGFFARREHADVQFDAKVGEITTDLGKHQYIHGRDNLAAEESEREHWHKLKTAFESFCKKVGGITKQKIKFGTLLMDFKIISGVLFGRNDYHRKIVKADGVPGN
ncbi:hypothetical protein PV325_006954, partial [Microctonus aethiopoides]